MTAPESVALAETVARERVVDKAIGGQTKGMLWVNVST
jgi:hypothetical protein